MDIHGKGILRFNKVGDLLLWSTALSIGENGYINVPTTLKKDVEDLVKQEFKTRTFKGKDKYILVDIKKGFISGYTNKDGNKVLKFVVMDLEVSKPTEKKPTKQKAQDIDLDF